MRLCGKIWCSVIAAGVVLTLNAGMVGAAPITIEEQGSFTVGGSYKQHGGTWKQENFVSEDGQRAYGDFAYVEYQKPVKAKNCR